MHPDFLNYALVFDSFDIEFIVDTALSSELTYRFNENARDFLFVAGAIWIATPLTRELVLPVLRPQNFLRCLENIRASLVAPPAPVGLEKIMQRGGWKTWIDGYSERAGLAATSAEDETIVDLLLSMSAISGSRGRIVTYCYEDSPVIDVMTHGEDDVPGNVFSEKYDPEKAVHQIDRINERMTIEVSEIVQSLLSSWRGNENG